MGKPILDVTLQDVVGRTSKARTVFDSGSHYTIVREAALPVGTQVLEYPSPRELRTATIGGRLALKGTTHLVFTIGDKMIEDDAMVSASLAQEAIIGAGTMQKWDISLKNENGSTTVVVGRDMRDPDVIEVDSIFE